MNEYRITTPKAALVIGSGGQKIGQAGEFDDAGLQAIRALKAEGVRTILVNPNMTAVQTSEGVADATYFLPITPEIVAKVIEREKPDSILVSYGGKTAFACALALEEQGTLERHNVQLIGTSIDTIQKTTDRKTFIALMKEASIPVPASAAATTKEEAIQAAAKTVYPVMLRADVLGEISGGVCADEAELIERCERAFASSKSVQVEEWLGGWKEIELEILRDAMGNCVVACPMENVDPFGVHTGDSIVVAPCQTLSGDEYQAIRKTAIRAAECLGIIGDANLRFALDPASGDFRLIEASARISRNTAFASRVSGFPLGLISARVALGFSLSEIDNRLSGGSKYCAEPALDYVAVRFPRWDFGKFAGVDRHLGSEMKSVGEALAFGRSFEESLQKAIRMTDSGAPGLACHPYRFKDVKEELRNPTDLRFFAVYSALAEGWSIDRIYKYARIDRWFIECAAAILEIELELRELGAMPAKDLLLRAKRAGFSDAQIAACCKTREDKVRAARREFALKPVVKQVDTVAGEFATKSNFLYMTWSGTTDDVKPADRGVLVLGSGPYRVGSSVEYDWCCVSALNAIRKVGQYGIMINCNPEAASTDFSASDRLYFEELSLERTLDVFEAEHPDGVLLSVGGPGAAALATPLSRLQIPVYGTAPVDIERASDRNKFGAVLDQLGIQEPAWADASSAEDARAFAEKVGYPVLIRAGSGGPSPSIGVAWDDASLRAIFAKASDVGTGKPAHVSKYVENSKEIEIDAVANKGEILVYAISEHIENAGVHSGDATVVLPAQRIYLSTAQAIKKAARKIAAALEITGPFNVQFLAKSANIQVIECSVRASRSMPFCSKVFRTDMIDMAVRAQLGAEVKRIEGSQLDFDHVGVRAAQFSYARLKGTDPVAGVEMTSTGEVGCIGKGVRDAFMKAMLSTGFRVPKGKILLSTGPIEDKVDFIDSAKKLLAMGYEILASSGTARFLQNNDIPAKALAWPLEDKKPNIADALRSREIGLVINIPKNNRETELKNDYIIRRMAVDLDIPLITNIKIAKQFTDSLEWYKSRGLEIKSREEYR